MEALGSWLASNHCVTYVRHLIRIHSETETITLRAPANQHRRADVRLTRRGKVCSATS